ncbi:MAG: hypothetical protein B6U75_03970 [Desulfurococcales archaeon ex4484_217_1]|nr:MAG: hypothetical protein B6U75_03970 [Desulfurococcales archaeon ex4484_217_1]
MRGKRFQKSIDLGAGTGRYTRLLTCTSKHTIALDFSFNMLKTLREKLRHHSKSIVKNIAYLKI